MAGSAGRTAPVMRSRRPRVALHGAAAHLAQLGECDGALGFAGEQDPALDGRLGERLERARVLHESDARAGIADGAHQVAGRVARVHGGGHRAGGHDAQIGEVEFEARFRIERDNVALGHAQAAQPAGDFLHGAQVLGPGIGEVFAPPRLRMGLAQGGRGGVAQRRLAQHAVDGSRTGFSHFLPASYHAEVGPTRREPDESCSG